MAKSIMYLLIGGGMVLLGSLFFRTGIPYLGFIGAPLIFLGGVFLSEGSVRLWFDKSLTINDYCARFQSMLETAISEILITSGTLNHEVYVKFGRIKEIIEDKVKTGVRFLIVCGPQPDPVTVSAYTPLLTAENFRIHLAKSNPQPHGLLVDGKRLRIEEPHSGTVFCRRNDYFRSALLAGLWFRRITRYYQANSTLLTSTLALNIIKERQEQPSE